VQEGTLRQLLLVLEGKGPPFDGATVVGEVEPGLLHLVLD